MAIRYCSGRSPIAGLSLIEAAIVLGVIGTVIGGIWVGAGRVMENMRDNRAVEAAIMLSSGMRDLLHRSSNAVYVSLGGGGEYDISSLAAAAKKAPANLIQGSQLVTPWGAQMNVYIGDWSLWGGDAGIAISFWGLSPSACIKLVVGVTSRFRDKSDLTSIYLRGGGETDSLHSVPWPISPAAAAASCQTDAADGKMTIVSFFFSVK